MENHPLVDQGTLVKFLREKHGLTQKELAEKLFVSEDLVSKWETGKRGISADYILPLGRIFSISAESLLVAGAEESEQDSVYKNTAENMPYPALYFEPFVQAGADPDDVYLACHYTVLREALFDEKMREIFPVPYDRGTFEQEDMKKLLAICQELNDQGKLFYIYMFMQSDEGREWIIKLESARYPDFLNHFKMGLPVRFDPENGRVFYGREDDRVHTPMPLPFGEPVTEAFKKKTATRKLFLA